MRFEIYEKKETGNKTFFPKISENFTSVKTGKIDLNNLYESRWDNRILEIPKENAKELNEKGKTAFTIITETTIQLFKNEHNF